MTVAAVPAASMVIIDDRPDLHVLIGQRRQTSTFVGGLIVYPGGGVDPIDRSEAAAARVGTVAVSGVDSASAAALVHAAVRETEEEVGLSFGEGPFPADQFVHVGHWVTPEGNHRRYDTHFFLARHPGGEPVADQEELTDAWWERPGDAVRRLDHGALEALTPTRSFLESLSRYRNVEETFAGTGRGIAHRFPWGVTTF